MAAAASRPQITLVPNPHHPKHPERVCWGCDRYCPADDLACGNGTVRTPHPVELFGDDWFDWAEGREADPDAAKQGVGPEPGAAGNRLGGGPRPGFRADDPAGRAAGSTS